MVNYGDLLERLILFDTYVLQSHRLMELPWLVRTFGFEHVVQLIQSDAFSIHFDIAAVGVFTAAEKAFQTGCFGVRAFRVNRDQALQMALHELRTNAFIRGSRLATLEDVLVPKLGRYPEAAHNELQEQVVLDVRFDHLALLSALKVQLQRQFQAVPDLSTLSLRIEPLDSTSTFEPNVHLWSNLDKIMGVGEDITREIWKNVLVAIGGLNVRVLQMRTYSALSGFNESEASVFGDKLRFLEQELSPDRQVARFRRVVEVGGLPDLGDAAANRRVNLSRLLELRNSPEIREFRHWLVTTDQLTDDELRERLSGVMSKISRFVHGKWGKTLRWLVTEAAGLMPGAGTVVGLATGAMDTFLLDRVVPSHGAVAFVSSMYPSIMEGR